MGNPESPRPGDQGGQGDHDDGELIQFGGLPDRWSAGPLRRLPRIERPVQIALAGLIIGLTVGFYVGRLSAPPAEQKPRSATPVIVPQLAATEISLTGARCAVQVGQNLQLGVEIANETHSPVTIGRITTIFPIGGLRTISTGTGPCGALPTAAIPASDFISPGGTAWVHATVAVRKACPQPLPVWFRVGYNHAGQAATVVLNGFPDLGSVSYGHCARLDSDFSSTGVVSVDPASGRSYSG